MKRSWIWLLAVVAGCSSSSEPPSPSRATPSASLSSAAQDDEPAVRAVFQRWLGAQNAGDFRAYEGLYAAKFEGVKRAGPRTRRFARDGWLADRKTMFAKKMSVEASDVKIVASGASARVHFVQSFSAGTFQDRGPKELVIVKDGSGWKIAREEMLQSTVGKADMAALDSERFAFVLHAGGPRVVLDAHPQAAWIKGAARLIDDGQPVVTEASVDVAQLPKPLALWQNRRVRLFGEGGEVCQAVVSGLTIVGRAFPHFGTRALWRGKPEDAGISTNEPAKPFSREEIAIAAFGMAAGDAALEGGQVLAATLKVEGGKCDGALWARDAKLDAPKLAAVQTPPADIEKRALEAFRKGPAYDTLEADYHKDAGANRGHWDEHGGARPVVRQFRFDGGPSFVAVLGSSSIGGCGEFSGELFALFELKGDRLVPANEPTDGWMPASAVDVDGDGKVEFIARESVLRAVGASWTRAERLSVPNFDCDC